MDRSFHLLNGEQVEENILTNHFKIFKLLESLIKTGGDTKNKFAMYIFLPYEKDGLVALLKNVNSDPEFFIKYCDLPNRKMVDIFRIPNFKFSYLTEKSPEIMQGVGLTLPFDDEDAKLDEMIEGTRLYVSKIIQKAFIEMNEGGTEAAAVTYESEDLGCSMYDSPPPPTTFIADHPFMFIIREENSEILFFVGIVLNPLEE